MLKNQNIRVGNIIASGINFSDISTIGRILSIGNSEQDFEQIYCECEESFEWFFKDNYCGVPVSDEWMIKLGFKKHDSLILPSYYVDISYLEGDFKIISATIEAGNQYVYIRHGEMDKPREEDDLVCIFNSDINGKIYVHYLQNLYFILTGKDFQFDF